MRRPEPLIGCLVLAMLVGVGARSTPPVVVSAVGDASDLSHFAFRVSTPSIGVVETPFGKQIVAEGFGTAVRRPGAPDLPLKTVRVAIPPGSDPVLSVQVLGESFRPIVPRPQVGRLDGGRIPVFKPASRLDDPTAVREPDPTIYEGREIYPAQVAWLGEQGAYRQQRYVDVVIAPFRYDPVRRGVVAATDLEIDVQFRGRIRTSSFAPDGRLESVYRDGFINYAQGTMFRDMAGPQPGAAASSAPLAPDATLLYRIKIRQNAVVRLDYTRMSTSGFLAQPFATWKLMNRGVEVPLEVHDANLNGTMDPGDWVEFYGQALDDEPKTVLNAHLPDTGQDIYEARDFTDEDTYFLSVATGTRSRLPIRASDPTNVRVPPTDFQAISHVEQDTAWRPLGGADPWYWSPTLSNNVSPTSRVDSVPLPGLASGMAPATVKVHLRGITEDAATYPDHHSQVSLSNSASSVLATNSDDGTFDGRNLYTHTFTWTYPGSGPTLTNPAQTTIVANPVAGLTSQQFILDWIEIQYHRSFTASADTLTFDWPDGDAEFQVSGITSAAPEVWELTGRVPGADVVTPVLLTNGTVTGSGPFTIRFRVDNDPTLPDGTSRRFIVFGAGAVATPADPDFTSATVADLNNTANQADLIVIANADVLGPPGSTTQTALTNLLNYHAGKGITSKVAMLQDVYDQFNNGLPGPVAIKNFLAWVMSTQPGQGWASPKPAYVLLLGDGSFDYKSGETNGNYVPTQILFLDDPQLGYYASDSLMAAVVGSDSLEDLVVGRIPARDGTTATNILQKMLSYQQTPGSGHWRQHALLISDRGHRDSGGAIDATESLSFESTNDEAASFMKMPPHTKRALKYFTDYCNPSILTAPCNTAQMNADIKSAVNGTDGVSDGASIIQFEGHGNFDIWSDDSFFTETDTDALTNGSVGPKYPWLLAHNCLTGGFETTAPRGIGEDWLKRNGGGAIAVFSPSSLSFTFVGQTVGDTVWNAVFGPTKDRTIDLPVTKALNQLCGQGSIEPCQGYVLMGDPATDLAFPTVGPATHVVATAGNARVDLSWTASTTAGATYDIYRSTNAATDYVKIDATSGSGVTYADTTASNSFTYFYYVVALDASGFESAWSNFNSDCAVAGPDCVQASPLNPNPPAAPTGLVVTDAQTGGRLNLTWNANTETDLKSYDVHWDVVSRASTGQYANVLNVGKTTSTTLNGLQNGTVYYIAITATNTSSKTSADSQEVTGKPTFVRGVKSPQWITSLHVDKSGGDALLTWNPVTTDIYGNALTTAHYEVYRGTTPNFVPGSGNKIGQPTAATFTDTGALGGAVPSYYYLVRAVDASGNPGGLGRQLPNGIDTMTLAKSQTTPGNVVLTWPSITVDFDGNPTTVDHYEVYARGTPFSRNDIQAGSIPLLASPTGTSVELTPPAGTQYYSVIVVDFKGNKSSF